MNLKPIFPFFNFLIQDFSFTKAYISLKFYKHVHNIHLEGTVYQIFYLGPSFDFMLKNGKIL